MIAPIEFNLQTLNISSILPMAITLGGGLLILTLDLLATFKKQFYVGLSMLTLLIALVSVFSYNGHSDGFFGIIMMDSLALLAQVIILLASLLFVPLALTSKRFHEFAFAEFYALFLIMNAGFQFMVATDNLIFVFIGLETASLALYTLIAMHNRDRSTEAAIKYFTMGAMAAGFYAFGGMLLYAMTGSIEIHSILASLISSQFANLPIILLAMVLFVAALGFKLSVVPFHTWTPDVYEGASAPLAGYMSVVPKIAGLIVAIRLFEPFVMMNVALVTDLLLISAVVSMTVGNVLALIQESVKRMLAYSSISHAGFVLTALVVSTDQSNTALFMYWILFMFANLGAFTMLWISRHKAQRFHHQYDHPYSKFSGMIQVAPLGAVIMGIFMLSLAGVPPFGLFFGKMYLIAAVVNAGFIGLAIVMVLNSAIAAYYYLKLVVYMFLKDPRDNDGTHYFSNNTAPFKAIVAIAALVSILSLFIIEDLLAFINSYLASSPL